MYLALFAFLYALALFIAWSIIHVGASADEEVVFDLSSYPDESDIDVLYPASGVGFQPVSENFLYAAK